MISLNRVSEENENVIHICQCKNNCSCLLVQLFPFLYTFFYIHFYGLFVDVSEVGNKYCNMLPNWCVRSQSKMYLALFLLRIMIWKYAEAENIDFLLRTVNSHSLQNCHVIRTKRSPP